MSEVSVEFKDNLVHMAFFLHREARIFANLTWMPK